MKKMKLVMMAIAVLFYIGATSVYAQKTRVTATGESVEPTGIEKEDPGIVATGNKKRGNVETEFKVEKGERSSNNEGPGSATFGDGKNGRIPDNATKKKKRDSNP